MRFDHERRRAAAAVALALAFVASPRRTSAQDLIVGAFIDAGDLVSSTSPRNHLFRNRGTTPRLDEIDLNMAAVYVKKPPSESSRLGVELTVQTGEDTKAFGFSATAPAIRGADTLRHLGPANVSYLAPAGRGLAIQGGIFNSFIGYDGLYVKDNFTYTRPWGADYTPYLMMGVNAAYPVASRVTVTGFLINGYFHLAHANDVPSSGAQIAYRASPRVTVKQTIVYGPHQSSTALRYWRVLSDTIVERKGDRATTAFEYQLGEERVAVARSPRALWMAAQLPLQWALGGPWSMTARPELCWDRDGRWIGVAQSIAALAAVVDYQRTVEGVHGIVRAEYRVDRAHGSGGGFFSGAENRIVTTQHVLALGVVIAFDRAVHGRPPAVRAVPFR